MKRRSSRAKTLINFIQQLEGGAKNINPISLSSIDSDSKNKSLSGKESGFESVILTRKRMYYKNIKRLNRIKNQRELSRRRLEIIIKFILYVISNIMNILAVLNYIVGTFFDNRHDEEGKHIQSIILTLDVCFSFYFTFEYLLLFFKEQKSLISFIFSWSSLIDAITIGPSIVSYFFRIVNFNFFRIFRIFRVFRILRIYKSLKLIQAEMMMSSEIDEEELNSLRFDPIKIQFFTIMVILIGVFFIGAGLMLGLQDLIENAWSLPSMNFIDAIYLMIVTYCTLGYGDILPTNEVSRFFIIIGLFCLIVIVSEQLSKMASLLRVWGPGWIILDKKGHIVVICDITIDFKVLT
jgi:voltage-gated potassium channel